MVAEKYIESMSISQICADIRSLFENKEMCYMLVHTIKKHLSNDEDPIVQFSVCGENLRGRPRVFKKVYYYKRGCVGKVIEKLLKSKELSETFHIQPLFDNDLGACSIHVSGILFISSNLIDRIIYTGDDDTGMGATIYFKNTSNIEISDFEISFLEKILEESGRYDLLI